MNEVPKKKDLVTVGAESLPAMITEAARALASAKTSAEVLIAKEKAKVAYTTAKAAARLAKQTKAHDDVVAKAKKVMVDALDIEAQAHGVLADQYDAAQDRGEVQKRGGQGKRDVPEQNIPPSADDIFGSGGRKIIHEARQIRDAERADPGGIRRTLDKALDEGHEPSKALVREAIKQALNKPVETPPRQSNKNPHYVRKDPSFSAVAKIGSCCCDISEVLANNTHDFLLKGFIVEGMRERHRAEVQAAIDHLKRYLEALDGTA